MADNQLPQNNSTESPNTNRVVAFLKKWGLFILMGLVTIITLGAVASRKPSSNKALLNEMDNLDKDVIQQKIDKAGDLDKQIENAEANAQQIAEQGQAEFDNAAIQANAENKTPEQKISDFNANMKKRR